MTQARSSYVRIIYQGKNITHDIAPFLTQFTFTDNSGGKADDLSITLEDRDGLWFNDWMPEKGAKISASIVSLDGNKAQSLPCGVYEVDEISYSFPPSIMTIKAVSSAISQSMRHERHNKIWENITLQAIAGELAGKNNLGLFFDAQNVFFERKVQQGVSDLEFLKGLCADYNLAVKVHDEKLIIYDQDNNSERSSVSTITKDDKSLVSAKFTSKAAKIYKSAKVSYHDAIKNQTFKAEASDGDEEGSGEVLEINERVENQGDALRVAQKRLNQANKREISATLTLKGDVVYLAGQNLTLEDFGGFDGKYTIEKVTHSLGDGFITTLTLSMGKSSKSNKKSKKSSKKKKASKAKKKTAQTKTPDFTWENARYYGD